MPGLYSKLSNLEIELEKGRISNFSTVFIPWWGEGSPC
jgi:hypothetical protein